MANLILNGSTSGSVTLSSPAVSGTTTLTLPTTSGTVLTNGTNTNFPAGSVLQVVQGTTTTRVANSTTTYADTTLTASITPKSASNKILVIVHQSGNYKDPGNTTSSTKLRLMRDSTEVSVFGIFTGFNGTSSSLGVGSSSMGYLDSPATTSSVTYKTQFANQVAAAFVSVQQDNQMSSITLMEIVA
jgi:hypothetical protein